MLGSQRIIVGKGQYIIQANKLQQDIDYIGLC